MEIRALTVLWLYNFIKFIIIVNADSIDEEIQSFYHYH